MKKISFGFLLTVVILLQSCATNPFTGKKTMALPGSENATLFPMAFAQYSEVLKESKVIKGTPEANMVERVGQKLKVASETYMKANGYEHYMDDYEWEFTLLDDEQVNAWCMPGGKIAFYTGIMPIAQTEAGVAAIMGHEIAHALANHGQQRMSASSLQMIGALAGNAATLNNPKAQMVFNQAYGVGSTVFGTLPFSRKHESEADKIGLLLMSIAGYEPMEAAYLWERMAARSGGGSVPEFMSTHPSNETRINNIKSWAADARRQAAQYR